MRQMRQMSRSLYIPNLKAISYHSLLIFIDFNRIILSAVKKNDSNDLEQ